MHIPDGFLSPPVWAALDVISVPAVGWAARRVRQSSEDHRLPLLGIMGAFVFAAQMINFPVGLGTSGHVLGGALLAIVLGPAAAVMVMTAILVLQALLFQDGGVLVLGANIFNMALAGVAAGYLPVRLWGRRPAAIVSAGALSVLVSALLALTQLRISGVPMPSGLVWTSLVLFTVSGLIEGAITLGVVRAIERLQPGSLHTFVPVPRPAAIAALAAAILLPVAGVWIASANPDGLQQLAAQIGLEETPAWAHAPMPDYQTAGSSPEWGRKAIAGVIGTSLMYAVCMVAGRRR